MKLVLAGSWTDYDRFISRLWEKDKDIGDYEYINSSEHLMEYDRDTTKIIKLGSFVNNPNRDRLLEVANERFDMRYPSERQGYHRHSNGNGYTLRIPEGAVDTTTLTRRWESYEREVTYTAPSSGNYTITTGLTASAATSLTPEMLREVRERMMENARMGRVEYIPSISDIRGVSLNGDVDTWRGLEPSGVIYDEDIDENQEESED